jgi:shikimate dehydrogenase
MVISGKTKVFGLIGSPVENSYSPFIYNEAFKIVDYDGKYVAFNVNSEALPAALQGIKALGISGVNVTSPLKEKVIPYLDHISETAKEIGAVNTIINVDGKLSGFNTDFFGFMKQLIDISNVFIDKNSWKFMLFGAGGAARSVIYSLFFFFKYIPGRDIESFYIVNRDRNRALKLKRLIDKLAGGNKIPVNIIKFNPKNFAKAVKGCDIFINASPVGFKGNNTLDDGIPHDIFSPEQIIIDLVYNHEKKSFIEYGKNVGAKVYTGLDMLLYQAEASFNIFTEHKISFDSIKKKIITSYEKNSLT